MGKRIGRKKTTTYHEFNTTTSFVRRESLKNLDQNRTGIVDRYLEGRGRPAPVINQNLTISPADMNGSVGKRRQRIVEIASNTQVRPMGLSQGALVRAQQELGADMPSVRPNQVKIDREAKIVQLLTENLRSSPGEVSADFLVAWVERQPSRAADKSTDAARLRATLEVLVHFAETGRRDRVLTLMAGPVGAWVGEVLKSAEAKGISTASTKELAELWVATVTALRLGTVLENGGETKAELLALQAQVGKRLGEISLEGEHPSMLVTAALTSPTIDGPLALHQGLVWDAFRRSEDLPDAVRAEFYYRLAETLGSSRGIEVDAKGVEFLKDILGELGEPSVGRIRGDSALYGIIVVRLLEMADGLMTEAAGAESGPAIGAQWLAAGRAKEGAIAQWERSNWEQEVVPTETYEAHYEGSGVYRGDFLGLRYAQSGQVRSENIELDAEGYHWGTSQLLAQGAVTSAVLAQIERYVGPEYKILYANHKGSIYLQKGEAFQGAPIYSIPNPFHANPLGGNRKTVLAGAGAWSGSKFNEVVDLAAQRWNPQVLEAVMADAKVWIPNTKVENEMGMEVPVPGKWSPTDALGGPRNPWSKEADIGLQLGFAGLVLEGQSPKKALQSALGLKPGTEGLTPSLRLEFAKAALLKMDASKDKGVEEGLTYLREIEQNPLGATTPEAQLAHLTDLFSAEAGE